MAIQRDFPAGKPVRLIGDTLLKQLRLDNDKGFMWTNPSTGVEKDVHAILQVTIERKNIYDSTISHIILNSS